MFNPLRFASKAVRSVITAEAFDYIKGRGVWYYRVLLDNDFSKTMLNIHKVDKFEREMSQNQRQYHHSRNRMFKVDDAGNIYDPRTGSIYGNVDEPKNINKSDEVFEEEANAQQG